MNLNNRHIKLFIGLIFIVFLSCEREIDLEIPQHESIIIVEGWIEQGRYPEVLLSLSAPYFGSIDSISIMDYSLTGAKVTISTDDDSEILTLTRNTKYFPPYVYEGRRMTGELNKEYHIEVIYRGDTITSSTTIPEVHELDSVWFGSVEDNDTLGLLYFQLTDNAEEKNYYRTLVKRMGKDERFIPTRTSVYDDQYFNGRTITLSLARGISSVLDTDTDSYYEVGDTVWIKFASIDKATFEFWNTYQNEIITSANPFSATNARIQSNIKNGFGIWYGSGVNIYSLIIR